MQKDYWFDRIEKGLLVLYFSAFAFVLGNVNGFMWYDEVLAPALRCLEMP